MDAVEFLREHERICKEIGCHDCIKKGYGCVTKTGHIVSIEEIVKNTEKWAKAHPYIKPCPFCGREPKLMEEAICYKDCGYTVMRYVKCIGLDCGIRTDAFKDKKEAIRIWNARVEI